jgi:thiosulfate/3-mercaptopyruvate sulfurtransferase
MASSSSPPDIIGQTLVSVEDAIALHPTNSSNDKIKFIDGSWFLGNERNGRQEYENGPRISQARFLDIDEIATKTPDNLPHMMPSNAVFGATMDALEISNDDHVIIYGSRDCMFVSRAYIQMKTMGHPVQKLSLMDGSLQNWIDAGGPIEPEGSGPTYPLIDNDTALKLAQDVGNIKYQATDAKNVIDMEELKTLIAEGKTTNSGSGIIVVDARANPRFMGEVEEPRPGLRLGHMPGAKNLFFLNLLNPENKVRFKPKAELKQLMVEAGIPIPLESSTKIISSCGSGVTACVLLVALDILGENQEQAFLYDGSWAQWGSHEDTPIVKV